MLKSLFCVACIFPRDSFHFRMTSEKYEDLVRNLIKNAKVLDHGADPCGEHFIPDTAVCINNLCYSGLCHSKTYPFLQLPLLFYACTL